MEYLVFNLLWARIDFLLRGLGDVSFLVFFLVIYLEEGEITCMLWNLTTMENGL